MKTLGTIKDGVLTLPPAPLVSLALIPPAEPVPPAVYPAYRPQTPTEGDEFFEKFCNTCKYRDGHNPDVGCPIWNAAWTNDIDSPMYPPEWVVRDGEPSCCAFVSVVKKFACKGGMS